MLQSVGDTSPSLRSRLKYGNTCAIRQRLRLAMVTSGLKKDEEATWRCMRQTRDNEEKRKEGGEGK